MAVIPESKTLPFEDQPFIKLNPQAMAEYMRRLVKSLEFQLKEISEVVNQNSRQLGDVANGNYISFSSNGAVNFYGTASFNIKRISQGTEPTVAVGELVLWRDSALNQIWLIYTDADEGQAKVELT